MASSPNPFLINNVDHEEPTGDDTDAIERGYCVNCSHPFNPVKKIMWTKTKSGTVLWWHLDGGCIKS